MSARTKNITLKHCFCSRAAEMFLDYKKSSYWEIIETPPPGVTIHVVRAANSDRWKDKTLQRLKAAEVATSPKAGTENSDGVREHSDGRSQPGRLRYHVLDKAGHWLHADNPIGLISLILPSLLEHSKCDPVA